MLVFKRRNEQSVVIGFPGGKRIVGTVKVVQVDRDGVRLGFDFPREVTVDREEVADAKAVKGTKPRGEG